jgi:ATP-dependent helicase/nuclease subunit A
MPSEDDVEVLPRWLSDNAPAEPATLTPLSPSTAHDQGAVVRSFGRGIERSKALARGTHTHRLLQALPGIAPDARAEAARRYLLGARELTDSDRQDLITKVQQVLATGALPTCSGSGSRASPDRRAHRTARRHHCGVRPSTARWSPGKPS